jgi:hypothetical protein
VLPGRLSAFGTAGDGRPSGYKAEAYTGRGGSNTAEEFRFLSLSHEVVVQLASVVGVHVYSGGRWMMRLVQGVLIRHPDFNRRGRRIEIAERVVCVWRLSSRYKNCAGAEAHVARSKSAPMPCIAD